MMRHLHTFCGKAVKPGLPCAGAVQCANTEALARCFGNRKLVSKNTCGTIAEGQVRLQARHQWCIWDCCLSSFPSDSAASAFEMHVKTFELCLVVSSGLDAQKLHCQA